MTILWELPVPCTSLLDGVRFNEGWTRLCTLSFRYEGDSSNVECQIKLKGCEAVKITYMTANSSWQIKTAYGALVDVGETEWLLEVQAIVKKHTEDAASLRHLMIYFDDGPAYEFICRDFEVVTKNE